VCFSPQGDLAGGLVVTTIGIDACRHLRGRSNYLLLAATPLVLGAHQIDESLVWFSLQNHIPHLAGRIGMWIYLVIAFVVVPILVPLAILRLQTTRRRQWVIAPFVVLGTGVAVVLLDTMLRGPVTVRLGSYHLAYSIGLKHGIIVIGLYIVATCGSLLFSGQPGGRGRAGPTHGRRLRLPVVFLRRPGQRGHLSAHALRQAPSRQSLRPDLTAPR